MKKLIFVVLLFASPVWAADYTVSTNTVARERALSFQATSTKQTNQQVLQKLVDDYLDDRIAQLKRAREKRLREGYETLSPMDKAKIDALIPTIP